MNICVYSQFPVVSSPSHFDDHSVRDLAPGGPFELPVSPRHAPSLPRARPCFLAKRLVPGSCFTFPAPALASAVSPRCSASCRWKLCSEARVGCTVGWSLGRARCSSKALPVTAENRSTYLLTPTPGLPRGVRAQQGRERPISDTALRRDGLPLPHRGHLHFREGWLRGSKGSTRFCL